MGEIKIKEKKIKIIYFIPCIAIGGAEGQLQLLIKKLNKKKYDITLCTIKSNDEFFLKGIRGTAKILELNINRISDFFNIKKMVKLFKIYKELKEINFHIIQGYLFYGKIFAFFLKLLSSNSVFISAERNTGYWRKRYHIIIENILNRYIDLYIVISNAVKKALIKQLNINFNKVKVVYNGIDEKKFYVNKNKRSKDRKIAIIGRFHPVKGHKFFFHLAKELINEYDDKLKFLVVGEGDYEENIISCSKELNVYNNTSFIKGKTDLLDIYNEIKLLLICSYSEGFSNVAAEAMMCGVPIVAFSVGSLIEVISSGETGYLVEFGNIKEMKEKVIILLEDDITYNKMSQNAIKKAKLKFTLNRLVYETEQIYENICKDK
ncbi:MAG: glycosyltransferase family 4 protein [Firmicutes bacterium]|nr:glycosyltransferase family 4 protein [Bacillota bacterium]